MRNFLHGWPLAGTLSASIAAGALLASCADENPWGSSSNQETGSISVSVSTDKTITTSKPRFRSEETNDELIARSITFPTSDDFKIRIEKADGTYSKTWNSVADFKAKEDTELFNTGVYYVTAFCGVKGEQGFNAPYFEASQQVTVLSEQTQSVSLTASLANAMVVIDYTDAFKDYMESYSATIYSAGLAEGIQYRQGENKAAFVEPNEAHVTLSFTTMDSQKSKSLEFDTFAPEAAHLYHITFDVVQPEVGDAQLTVSFDDSLTDEPVTIDLSDKLFTTAEPVIKCVGFENGDTLDMLAGTSSDSETGLKMQVFADGGLQNAFLSVTGPNTNKEIDLCDPSTNLLLLEEEGIKTVGFANPTEESKNAWIDFTEYSKSLREGSYTLTLRVVDQTDCDSEPASVTLDCNKITAQLISSPDIVYASGEAFITIEYNGLDPLNEIQFLTSTDGTTFVSSHVTACETVTPTRAYASKEYRMTVALTETTWPKIHFRTQLTNGTELIPAFIVPVNIPEYSIEATDPYSQFAYVKISTTETAQLENIIRNIQLRKKGDSNSLNIIGRDAATGIITINGLNAETDYTIQTDIAHGQQWTNETDFSTETEVKIPNGDFSQTAKTIDINPIDAGGKYKYGATTMQNKSSILVYEPTGWASVNAKTCYTGSNPMNTWFVVPSTLASEGQVTIRSVAYDHNGTLPELDNHGLSVLAKYSRNKPTSFAHKEPGEIFLGTYSFNGQESRTDGVGFDARPSAVKFDYKYSPVAGEKAEVSVDLLAADGTVLASAKENLNAKESMGSYTVNLTYNENIFGKKASTIKIRFRSTNSDTANVPLPSDIADVTNKTDLGGQTIPTNKYKSLCVGSVLTIDNVKAEYGSAPAGRQAAPKRTAISSKKK